MIAHVVGAVLITGATGILSYKWLDTQQALSRDSVTNNINAVEQAKANIGQKEVDYKSSLVSLEEKKLDKGNAIGYITNPWFMGIVMALTYGYVKKG